MSTRPPASPEESSASIVKGSGCRGRSLVGCGLLVILLLVTVVGLLYLSSERKLRAFLAKLDEEEPGWRLQDIEANRAQVSDAQNSAKVIESVARSLPPDWSARKKPGQEIEKDSPESDLVWLVSELPPEIQLSPTLLTEAQTRLTGVGTALREAKLLADMPKGRFPTTWPRLRSSDFDMPAQKARSVISLLRLEAYRQAQENHADAALLAVSAILNSGRSIGDDPNSLAQLVRAACEVVGVDTLERVLAQTQPSDAMLARLRAQLKEEIAEPLSWYATRGDRAQTFRLFESVKSGEASLAGFQEGPGQAKPSSDVEESVSSFGERLMVRMWELQQLEVETEAVAIAKAAPEDQEAMLQALVAKASGLQVLPAMYVGTFAKQARSYRYFQAKLRCAMTALAAEQYRLKNNRWPEKLKDLVTDGFLTEIPADPLGPGPIRMIEKEASIVIYSVGPDGLDNQGLLERKDRTKKGVDIGIQLWEVTKRRQPSPDK